MLSLDSQVKKPRRLPVIELDGAVSNGVVLEPHEV